MLTYKITDFNSNTGQIKIIVNEHDFGNIVIDLIPDSEGKYPTGQELDTYIRGFIPVHELERLEKVKSATNAAEIEQLVEPIPQTIVTAVPSQPEQVFIM